MSNYLWNYYLEDDVERFRHLLETAGYNVRNTAQKGGGGGGGGQYSGSSMAVVGGSGIFGTSPTLNTKGRKGSGWGQLATPGTGPGGVTLTKSDVNWRDSSGLTILHHVASSATENALGFAQALIEHPLVDLYVQDLENGWTALHRAFYFGNITIARAILERDTDNALGRAIGGISHNTLGLIKIKDKEGHGPLDLYAATIQDRTLRPDSQSRPRSGSDADSEPDQSAGNATASDDDGEGRRNVTIRTQNVDGDECFTFGSNRNITLGFGDEDDRQYPEKITLKRPDHLLQRFYREHLEQQENIWTSYDLSAADNLSSVQSMPVNTIPWVARSRPLIIQDMHMSKLHTAVLTTDPESNLYMCGHGPGGRLGIGHERTQFTFTCVEGGALAGKKVAAVGLGQNHSLALSDEGEIFTWGSNEYGQLGYSLPRTGLSDEVPVQTLPRQVFGPLKREIVVGISASRIHSVAHTSTSLYTWGKNEGQLGLVDSDARSLEYQTTPRKVAASLFASPIASVAAIDRATICLLTGTHECWVFANYGYAKIQFPLDGFSNYFLKQSFLVTKYDNTVNHITKITAGGDTICAMSSSGEVFSLSVSQPHPQSANTSTTNPTKIKGALSPPYCIWSLKKGNMAARDVGVDADGSIILSTEEGSVWKRSRRAKIRDATAAGTADYKPKDYKFSRQSGLTRVIAVRASSYGAYAAIRRDCNVTKTQIAVEEPTLWRGMFSLLCFKDLRPAEDVPDSESEEPEPRFWQGRKRPDELLQTKQALLESKDLESQLRDTFRAGATGAADYDAYIATTVSDLRLPVHQFVIAGRSRILRDGLQVVRQGGEFVVPDLLRFEVDGHGKIVIQFQGLDVLTMANLVLYCYTDNIVDYWHHTRRAPVMAFRYRQVRTELMKIAANLKMQKMEAAVRQMIEPAKSMHMDMETAIKDSVFFENSDVRVQLADEDIFVHSALVCTRCPFFEGLFMGRAGGAWLDERRGMLNEPSEAVQVDLRHIESNIFRMVLRHLYADTGEELFDDVVSADLDEFLDLVMEVMGVANELMLDRLSQICQAVIGRYVNARNVCSLVNAIAPSSVAEFKDASLEYMCLNLEAMLHGGLLDELDEDLLLELDDIVRDNQLACMPFAKSGRAEALLHERHPDLVARLDRDRQAKIDSIKLHTKYQDMDNGISSSFRLHTFDEDLASPSSQKARRRSSNQGPASQTSPALKGKAAVLELGTSIDENAVLDLGRPAINVSDLDPPRQRPRDVAVGSPMADVWYNSKGKQLSSRDATPSEFRLDKELESRSPRSSTPATIAAAGSSPKPWGASPSPGAKLDLKDIMGQTPSNRVSNLSLGIAASRQQSSPEGIATPAFVPKLSQKERKKMQQQQAAVIDPPAPDKSSPGAKSSPWQIASSHRVPSLKDVVSAESVSPQQGRSPKPARSNTPTTPQLTMRQTIANTKQTPHSKASIGPGTQPAQRSVSGPAASKTVGSGLSSSPRPTATPHQQARKSSHTPSTGPSKAVVTANDSEFPSIQSVRHQPRPVEPSLQLSMADILSQQQLEKDIIREAAAKRSLQEIQAEQEFQEWWDKEAARMKEEEEELVLNGPADIGGNENSTKRGGKKGGRGGGPSRGKRGGKGDGPSRGGSGGVQMPRGTPNAIGRGRGRAARDTTT